MTPAAQLERPCVPYNPCHDAAFCDDVVNDIRAHVANEGHGVLNLGQVAFIEKAASQGVKIHVIDNVDEFTELINWCRRPKGVVRR